MRLLVSRMLFFVVGGIGVLVLLELVLRVLPVTNGAYAADPSDRWPTRTLIANSSFTYSIGWNASNIHHGHVNNLGYVSPFDYEPGASGIVVIGDSYVESRMNDYDDTLQGQLVRQLREPQRVMNFGMSGADLAHYVGTAQLIGQRFAPSWAVIVITAGDYSGGFAAEPGFFRWAPERDPPVELVPEFKRSETARFMRSLALIRYLRGNLMVGTRDLIHLHHEQDDRDEASCSRNTLSAEDQTLVMKVAESLPRALGLSADHVILVFDSDRKAMYTATPAAARECPNRDHLARNRLMEVAALRGLQVIDSAPVFQAYYGSTHERVDHLPQDGHWNPAAHRLMAREVAQVINDDLSRKRFSLTSSAR